MVITNISQKAFLSCSVIPTKILQQNFQVLASQLVKINIDLVQFHLKRKKKLKVVGYILKLLRIQRLRYGRLCA